MKRSFLLTVALIGVIGTSHVLAQQPLPNIPTPAPSTIFPINQPATFRYTDAQGMGSITFTDLGLDQMTGFDLLRVNITQNANSFDGSGIATPLPGAARPLNNLVAFTVVDRNGVPYFFAGKMGLGVEFQGQGTFHPVSDPTQIATWGLLFVPGTPGPGPQPITLSLNLDRGCGSVYPLGAPQVITYSASANDTLTLLNQRVDGTFVLFSNQSVIGGQTYSIATSVANVVGQRTLILRDSAGTQTTCTFTGQ
jgi:hypothetical protein